jgi:hypothetical protein
MLYWTAYEEGLGFTDKSSYILTTDNFTNTSLIKPDFHWEYGFRLQGGYTPPCSSWTYKLGWTYLASKATGQHNVDSNAPSFLGIFPIWSMSPNILEGDYVSTSKMRWYLHTNLIDFVSQYSFNFFECLKVCPLLGIRCAILNQKLHTEYSGGTFASGVCDDIMRNRFVGVGPRLGADATWNMGWGFSLYGLVAGTPMYGWYHISHKDEYLEAELFKRVSNVNQLAVSVDGQIGLQWKGKVLKNWPAFNVMLSWEEHVFFNQNRLYRGEYDFFKKDRDLILQGITLSVSFCF